ncbi:hypothetical protein AJ80_04366 [Polytolypa hystricis UAMH7299]|uniref:Uncharacterized protein n=1 Tax=Polytolypa hystricis (strain UAMH7299) TaxID=1447883 RepID=A0A2B7YCE8_POLH7|nr:hypothetical protein AJ80_04366 [Polytolypa hystricis UAMH7299]
MTSTATTRLHITPLNPPLLDAILHPSIRDQATDISFHEIPTFPENNYGYVTLPKMEAEKVVKKLNGAILKGKKLKLQEARPSKRPRVEDNSSSTPPKADSPGPGGEPSKKRKAANDVLPGYELPSERHIKRGWTEPASAKDKRKRKSDKKDEKKPKLQQKSKFTEKSECLFRTKVPPNRKDETDSKKSKKDKKDKKDDKDNKDKKDKKDKKEPDDVVVHEFEKTFAHPSFIRADVGASGTSTSTQFIEGKGWVDAEGNVKEPAPEIRRPKQKERSAPKLTPIKDNEAERKKVDVAKATKAANALASSSSEVDSEDGTSSSGSSSSDSSDGEDATGSPLSDDDRGSSSASSSEESSASSDEEATSDEDEDENEIHKNKDIATLLPPSVTETPKNTRSKASNHLTTPDATSQTPTTNTEIHPLEALFKRPAPSSAKGSSRQKPALGINTQFSFFEGGDDDDHDDGEGNAANVPQIVEPHTPFTKHDLHTRSVRSAAPTPDTAAPTRFSFFDGDDGDDDDDEDEEMEDAYPEEQGSSASPSQKATTGKPVSRQDPKNESDFAKWFWENRGENNRAWKRRRREAAKEKRQRDNRTRGTRGKG